MRVRSTPDDPWGSTLVKLVELGGFDPDRAVLGQYDLLDLELRLAQLGLAMTLQGGAPLVRLDRLFELVVAALQALHQLLQLGQRLFKAQGSNVGRNARSGRLILGHSLASRRMPRAWRTRGRCARFGRHSIDRPPPQQGRWDRSKPLKSSDFCREQGGHVSGRTLRQGFQVVAALE